MDFWDPINTGNMRPKMVRNFLSHSCIFWTEQATLLIYVIYLVLLSVVKKSSSNKISEQRLHFQLLRRLIGKVLRSSP